MGTGIDDSRAPTGTDDSRDCADLAHMDEEDTMRIVQVSASRLKTIICEVYSGPGWGIVGRK